MSSSLTPTSRRLLAGGLLAAAMGAAQAGSSIQLSVVPTAWRIENYSGGTGGGNVVVWYTGVNCGSNVSGELTLAAPSEGDKNRFFALVTEAKLTNHAIFVYYDSASCIISSFGMDG